MNVTRRTLPGLLLLVPVLCLGQEKPARPEVFLRTAGAFWDNLISQPGGQGQIDEWGMILEARARGSFDRLVPGLRWQALVEQTVYEDFRPATAVGCGLRWDRRPHAWEVNLRTQGNRPAFYVRDELDRKDITRIVGRYTYRVNKDWRLGGEYEYLHENYAILDLQDSDTTGWSAFGRYTGWGRKLTTELGLGWEGRDAASDLYDRDERSIELTLRSSPLPPLSLMFRYRWLDRRYLHAPPISRYYGRTDQGEAIAFSLDWQQGKRTTWGLYLGRDLVDSALPGDSYETRYAIAGVTLRL